MTIRPKYTLRQVVTTDDLILSGLYHKGDKSKPALIYIHGFYSDFYTHRFVHEIAAKLSEYGYGFVLAQHRGTGIEQEFLKIDGEGETIGSLNERLDDAHLDISAWIKFLIKLGYKEVVLVGHSLGTFKVVRYLFEGEMRDMVSKLLLLAPFDKNGYLESKTKGGWKKDLAKVEAAVDEGKGSKRVSDEMEDYPLTYKTYLSWYAQTELNCTFDFYRYKKYDFPVLRKLKVPVKVIVGDIDPFFVLPGLSTPQDAVDVMERHIPKADVDLIKGCDHEYDGFQEEVAQKVITFLEHAE